MARVEVERSWETSADAAALEQAVRGQGLEVNRVGEGTLELTGGSQLRMRLLGGWFVKPTVLPKRGTLVIEGSRATLRLEDAMGFGVMDPKFKGKYETTLGELADAIQRAAV